MIGVKYGDFDLQGNGCRVVSTDVYSPPTNRIQADELAERDGRLVVRQSYDSKTFKVAGLLRADTRADVETLRDTFNVALGKRNQPFDIDYAGSIRRYLATPENIIISDRSLSTFGFEINFVSPDGMGWDVENSELIAATSVSLSSTLVSMTVGGTYKAQPSIVVVWNTIVDGTAKTVTIGNGESLRALSITRDWASGDRLEIDTLRGTVFINAVSTDFNGQLPEFEPGAGNLSYLDDFTSRSATVSASYVRRWL